MHFDRFFAHNGTCVGQWIGNERVWQSLALLILIGPLASRLGHADDLPQVTAETYARAERFLSWNKDRYVTNADIQHHWIGDEDRFWYQRTERDGSKQFVVVDASTGVRSPAFNHERIAAALARATSEDIASGALPFSSFRYTAHDRAIEFDYKDRLWSCQLVDDECVSGGPALKPHELPSPDGRWVAFVEEHNLWMRDTVNGTMIALTTDGAENFGYAGAPGFSTHAVTDLRQSRRRPPQVIWSPNSRYLLTHRLDERAVKDAFLIQSVPENGETRPKLFTYKYAMPGDEAVPLWQPMVFDVYSRRKVVLTTPPLTSLPQTPIEKRDAWWSADSASIYYLQRARDAKTVVLNQANPLTGRVREVLRETGTTPVQTNANNVFDLPLARTLNNADVLWYSQRDGWGHLYYYDASGKALHQLTRGPWAVRDVVRVDEERRKIYFMASGREAGIDPYQQLMYSVAFNGSQLRLLTPEPADHSLPHPLLQAAVPDPLAAEAQRVPFSRSGRYFVHTYSRPDLMPTMVLRTAEGKLVKELERADISKLTAGGHHGIAPFRVLAADGKTEIYGNLFRPSNFDARRRYPVIDATYPGPQAIRTAKRFTNATFDGFEAQSLAELGFIVVTIDGRGTPHRSKDFLNHSYGRMHRASDLVDHIAGIRQLAQRYPYMDLNAVGIDGVSGGGFMAALGILAYPEFYKVAVAAQGNHDQSGYLAAWGESYQGAFAKADYRFAATPPLAANLQGKLFLMHGELDDNVSPALTLRLVDALIKANKDFELLVLPNANHAAFVTSTYFIRRKWDFFVRNLLQAEPPEHYAIQPPQ